MSVILQKLVDGKVVFFNTVSDCVFGPILESEKEAEDFLSWLRNIGDIDFYCTDFNSRSLNYLLTVYRERK